MIHFSSIKYLEPQEAILISGRTKFSAETPGNLGFYRDKDKLVVLMEESRYGLLFSYWKGSYFSFQIPVSGVNEVYYGHDLIWARAGQSETAAEH